VSVPGPPEGLWAVSLLLWGGSAAIVGEAVRATTARWVMLWRSPEPIERLLLDFYLGGAVLYGLAATELGLFLRPVVLWVPVAAAAVILVTAGARRRRRTPTPAAATNAKLALDRWGVLALGSALALFVVELGAAMPVATGNTFDASLLTTYVSLLLQHGSIPLSFQPSGASAILYPQGTTVWIAWAQVVFALPPARASLLITPLFLALIPLAGFVLGRRLSGSAPVGGAFAVACACLGPATRAQVGGSNDFVFALPLVLLLGAQWSAWTGRRPLGWTDAAAYGLLLGYSAVINVTGAEWILPGLIVAAALASPRFAGSVASWFGRWGAAFAAALLAGAPSFYVLLNGRLHPATLAGELSLPPGSRVGISIAQFIGGIDPFLFRGGDIELAPIPYVRLELAILLVGGVAALLWYSDRPQGAGSWAAYARWAAASGLVLIAWLGVQLAASTPGSPVTDVAFISSGAEISLCLFTIYGLVAAVPLALAFERFAGGRPTPVVRSPRPGRWRWLRYEPRLPWLAAVFAVGVVVPAAVLTPVSLTPVLSETYGDFGNVSSADFDLLSYAGAHLSPGERVLVAPGSAAEFLPGYVRGIVLVYPMEPGWRGQNSSYALVVQELANGTLDAAGRAALASLELDSIVVTGNNTVLWPAFWAAPLLQAGVHGVPTFPVEFHEADAWVFNASACRPAPGSCP